MNRLHPAEAVVILRRAGGLRGRSAGPPRPMTDAEMLAVVRRAVEPSQDRPDPEETVEELLDVIENLTVLDMDAHRSKRALAAAQERQDDSKISKYANQADRCRRRLHGFFAELRRELGFQEG